MLTELQNGDLIADRFRVEALLGEGGIARVYKVRHVRLGSVHAVKVLSIIRPALADRLLLEGRIQAQIHHPNLVRVTDVVEHDQQPCLVMEYVEGTHLGALLAHGQALDLDTALQLFACTLAGVATAHDAGVLHRDLKPANILLARHGDAWVPKVSDFGIAKAASGGLRVGETRTGIQMGTPGYMAPEQIEDSATVDHRADIFALGAILYQMLCGTQPYNRDTTFGTLRATIEGKLTPVRDHFSDCPPGIAQAIECCLRTDMNDRFSDCHALADALFLDRPQLRALVRRRDQSVLADGLHPPEIADSTPSTPPLIDPTVVMRGTRWQPTLAPDDDTDRALPPPQAATPQSAKPQDLLGGIAPASDRAPGSSRAGALSPMGLSQAGSGMSRAGIPGPTIDDINAAAAPAGRSNLGQDDDPLPSPHRRGTPAWFLGAAVVVMIGAGAWMLHKPDKDSVPVEALPPVAPVAEPANIEPDPVDTKAASGEPATTKPEVPKPNNTKPEVPKPNNTKPEVPKPDDAKPAPPEPIAAEPVTAEPVAAEPVAAEPVAAEPERAPNVEAPVTPAATPITARVDLPAAGAPPTEPPPSEPPPSEPPPTEAPQAAAAPVNAPVETALTPPPTSEPTPEATPATAPVLTGTWTGTANEKPLTIKITSQEGERLVGEIRFSQGAIERVARITGTVSTDSHRLSFHEEGGADLSFTGVIRGTGMMGTYGRGGHSASLSWSARRQ